MQRRFHPPSVPDNERLIQAMLGAQPGNGFGRNLRVHSHLIKKAPRCHLCEQEAEHGYACEQQNPAYKSTDKIAHSEAPVIAARLVCAARADLKSRIVSSCFEAVIISAVEPISTIRPPAITAITSAMRPTTAGSCEIRRYVSECAA